MIPQRASCAKDYMRAVEIWTGRIHYDEDGSWSGLTLSEFEDAMQELETTEPVGKTADQPDCAKRNRKCASLVKSRIKHPRKSLARDDRALTRIEGLKGIAVIGAAGGISVEPPSPTAKSKASKAANDNRDIPRWQDAEEMLKGAMFNEALANFGEPLALTLNIAPDVVDKAKAGQKGFASNMLDLMRNELRRDGIDEVEIWIAVEISDEGRIHIHGGFACAADNLERIKAAFERAGGAWTGGGRQFVANPFNEKPMGWARYSLKRVCRARNRLKGSVIARTSGINDAAPKILDAWRRKDREHRRTQLPSPVDCREREGTGPKLRIRPPPSGRECRAFKDRCSETAPPSALLARRHSISRRRLPAS